MAVINKDLIDFHPDLGKLAFDEQQSQDTKDETDQ
jgi:hypothetical protein